MNQHAPLLLLVDGSPDNLEMYTVGLAHLGVMTLMTSDGAAALDQVKTQRPDVIVTELSLGAPCAAGISSVSSKRIRRPAVSPSSYSPAALEPRS